MAAATTTEMRDIKKQPFNRIQTESSVPLISIIIPVLNESDGITEFLRSLQPLRNRGHEIIIIDGYSEDDTASKAKKLCDRVLLQSRGRARQMNRGSEVARKDIFWFLHADSIPPQNADAMIIDAISRGNLWGRFDVTLTGTKFIFRIIENLMNFRSRITSIATGDQGIFVRAEVFKKTGGFPDMPFMEDIALCKMLKCFSKPECLRSRIVSSSRRWENHGIMRTILIMWYLRLLYFLGADPRKLSGYYR